MKRKIYRLKPGGVKFAAVTLVKFSRPRKQSIKFAAVFWVKFKYRPKKNGAKFSKKLKITPECKIIYTRFAASALKILAFFA